MSEAMTPNEVRAELDPVTKVARDLTEIVDLAARLETQAVHKANDRLMPGGLAMVALAHDASASEWAEQIAYQELRHLTDPVRFAYPEHVADEDDQDAEDPLRTLLFWSEAWREENGYPLEGRRPTLTTEAGLIRHMLNWAWENEVKWDDFARDINSARRTLEAILHAGRQPERTRVPCSNVTCETRPRLIKVYGATEAFDFYKCTSCKNKYDQDEFERAYARYLRSEGAERYVLKADAIGTLRAQGRPERTIRQWFIDGKVVEHRDEIGRVFVWWPDLWSLHLVTQTRRSA